MSINWPMLDRLQWKIAGCITAIGILGCSDKPETTYPVSGIVQWPDGQAAIELAGGNVNLQIIEGPATRVSPRANIEADGSFVVQTFEPGDGAPAGKYRASVMPVKPTEFDDPPRKGPIVDPSFLSFKTSKLQIEVKPEPNEIKLTVTRAKDR